MSKVTVTNAVSVVRVTNGNAQVVRVQTPATPVVRVSDVGIQGPTGQAVAELCLSIIGPTPTNTRVVRYTASSSITFNPTNAIATCGTPPTADTVFPLKNAAGATIGTVTFLSGASLGVVALSPTTFARGAVIDFFTPTAINDVADVSITLPGVRNL